MMSSRERVGVTLSHKEADRVPLDLVRGGQDIFLQPQRKKAQADSNENKNLQYPVEADAVGPQGHDLMVLHEQADGDEGAEQHPQGADLVNDHGNAAQAVFDNQAERHLVFDHVINAFQHIHQQIQRDESAQAEAENFQKLSGKIAGDYEHVVFLSGIIRGPASV